MNRHPQRKSTRAPGFDYRDPGVYFITICEYQRRNRFGLVVDHEMQRNAAGKMVFATWRLVVARIPAIRLDAFVVMPNHFHALVHLHDVETGAGTSLSAMVGWFKTMTTNRYIRGTREQHWPPFDGHLWQRSFHDRIVRGDAELARIRTYIANNPACWAEDMFFEPATPPPLVGEG